MPEYIQKFYIRLKIRDDSWTLNAVEGELTCIWYGRKARVMGWMKLEIWHDESNTLRKFYLHWERHIARKKDHILPPSHGFSNS